MKTVNHYLVLFICCTRFSFSLGMEKPEPLIYRLIGSDGCEVAVQPKFLKTSEPLESLFTRGFKEAQVRMLQVDLPGAALETLVSLMHLDQINDEKKLRDHENLASLTQALKEDSNSGAYILDMLGLAEKWMVCPMIKEAIATEAADLIFHDEQARAECIKLLPVQEQLDLLGYFSLASQHARNYIPALQVLHAMKHKKELKEDEQVQKDYDWASQGFALAALGHIKEWVAQCGAKRVADFIQSSVLLEIDPHFKDKLYKELEEPELVDAATVYAVDIIDDTHVVYGGGGTVGILDLQNNTVKDLQNNLLARNSEGPIGPAPLKIGALAYLKQDRFIINQQQEHRLDISNIRGCVVKGTDFNSSLRRILLFDAHLLLVTTDKDFDIQVLSLDTLSRQKRYSGHENNVNCLLKVGNSKLASGSHDCSTRIWDLHSPTNQVTHLKHTDPIYSLLLLNNRFLVSFGRKISIYDMELEREDTDQIGRLYSLVSCDGVNNTYGGSGTVELKTVGDCTLKKLLDAISEIPELQVVIPFNRDHLLAVYGKYESVYISLPAALRVWNIHTAQFVSQQLIEKDSIASITCADNKIIYGTTTGLMIKHVPQAYPSLTALLERIRLE